MHERDKSVFIKAAQRLTNSKSQKGGWIFVRQSSPHAQQYFGRSPYVPKPIAVKAKTAKNPVSAACVAGLVADPRRWPGAYDDLLGAIDVWDVFRGLHRLGCYDYNGNKLIFRGTNSSFTGFSINTIPGHQHEGCLLLHGSYLYADHDLFDVVLKGEESLNESTTSMQGPRFLKSHQIEDHRGSAWEQVEQFVNGQLGRQMILHGEWANAVPSKHYRKRKQLQAIEFQDVTAFTPEGLCETWSKHRLEAQYRAWGRQ